jgi:hypothetical protein
MAIFLYEGWTVPTDGSPGRCGFIRPHRAAVKKPAAATRMIAAPEVMLKT